MTRIEFVHALGRVETGQTPADVEARLGPPGEIRGGGEVWAYGVSGPLGMATLGQVFFRKDRVVGVVGEGEPPSERLIGEEELRASLVGLYRSSHPFDYGDPLRVIRATNGLWPLGREKALAVVKEYARVSVGTDLDAWLFWTLRVLFVQRRPGGAFPVPRIGLLHPRPPKNPVDWPTYPILTLDDVPVSLFRGTTIAGEPERLYDYIEDNAGDWALRAAPLRPPDDPFPVYEKAVVSPAWPYPNEHTNSGRFAVPYLEDEGYVLREILRLVRTAYRPVGMEEEIATYVNGLDYGRFHDEYRRLDCRWDTARQCYVREDG